VTALADPLDVIPDDYQAPADHFFSHDLGPLSLALYSSIKHQRKLVTINKKAYLLLEA
jgi:hypothetical protein